MAEAQVNVIYGQQEEPEMVVSLEDHLWLVVSLAGQPVIPGTQITADFSNGQVAGVSGCNNYSAPYEMSDANLTTGVAAVTMMACGEPQGVMEQENPIPGLAREARRPIKSKGARCQFWMAPVRWCWFMRRQSPGL